MRKLIALGDCQRCQKRGPVWVAHVKVLDFGTGLVMEPKALHEGVAFTQLNPLRNALNRVAAARAALPTGEEKP